MATTCITNCLVCVYSENPNGFSSGSFSFTKLVLANATSHTQNRCAKFERMKFKILFIITFSILFIANAQSEFTKNFDFNSTNCEFPDSDRARQIYPLGIGQLTQPL